MEGRYQYPGHGLPRSALFLMLKRAFTDSSPGKVVKASATSRAARAGMYGSLTRRPNRGQRGPVRELHPGTVDWHALPRGTACGLRRAAVGRSITITKQHRRSSRRVLGASCGPANDFRYGVDRMDAVAGESLHGGGAAKHGGGSWAGSSRSPEATPRRRPLPAEKENW